MFRRKVRFFNTRMCSWLRGATQSSDRMKSVELPFPEAKGDLAGKGSV